MITFIKTRDADLVEYVANSSDIRRGACNGGTFSYDPDELYFAVKNNDDFRGIVRAKKVAQFSYDCHALFLTDKYGNRKDSVEIGREFFKFFFENYPVECIISMASDKFKNGKIFCSLIGMKRCGEIPNFFGGDTNVTLYWITKEAFNNGKR